MGLWNVDRNDDDIGDGFLELGVVSRVSCLCILP